jgi:hypothetical protein
MSSSLLLSATRRNLSLRSASALAKKQMLAAAPSRSSTRAALFSTQPIEEDQESFLTGSSSLYAEQMYEMYEQDPNSVHESWRQYFDNMHQGVPFRVEDYSRPTAVASSRAAVAAAVSADY